MNIKIFELEKLYIRALNDIIEIKVKKNIKTFLILIIKKLIKE